MMKLDRTPVIIPGDGFWHLTCPACGLPSLVYGRVNRICEHGVTTSATWVCKTCSWGAPDTLADSSAHFELHVRAEHRQGR